MDRLRRLLLATDFSDAATAALEQAARLARQYDAELHAIHIIVDAVQIYGLAGLPVIVDVPEAQKQAATESIARMESAIEMPLVKAAEWGFTAAHGIIEYARAQQIDLIVVGTHGRSGMARWFLGSVAAEVVRTAGCPVLVVGIDQPSCAEGYRQIVAGIDFSDASLAALEQAARLAATSRAALTALHIVDIDHGPPYHPPEFSRLDIGRAQAELNKTLSRLKLPVVPEMTVLRGRAHEEISQFAAKQGVDLIVLGTHGLGLLGRWLLGSVTERVLRSAPCHVLVHRQPDTE